MRSYVPPPSAACSRADAVTTLCALALSALALPRARPACAADIGTALALAPLLQLRAEVAFAEDSLAAEVLRAAAAPDDVGVQAATGDAVVGRVRLALQQFRPRESAIDLASAARQAGVIDVGAAEAVRSHGREAQERLAAVVESDAQDALLRRDDLRTPLPFMRPERLLFVHRTLVVALEEVDAAFLCFREDERRDAIKLASGATNKVPLIAPGMPGYEPASLRGDAVSVAIGKLPGTPPARFRSDLQNTREDEWRAQSRSAPAR